MPQNTDTSYEVTYPRGRRGERLTARGVWSYALMPLARLYSAGSSVIKSRRSKRRKTAGPARFVSVGNIEIGGNGKTPFAIHLVEQLLGRGHRPVYISRGFRSQAEKSRRGVTVIVPAGRSLHGAIPHGVRILYSGAGQLAAAIGDEGAMVAMRCPDVPLAFGPDRNRVIEVVTALFDPSHVILDDAFQTWAVGRDVDIVLLDSEHPVGNGRIIPAGSLREHPVELKRADIIGFNGIRGADQIDVLTRWVYDTTGKDIPVFGIGRDVELLDSGRGDPVESPGEAVAAVSSIGRPDRFEASLAEKGVGLAFAMRYPDHHRYGPRDIEEINSLAAAHGIDRLVTTEKDWVKLLDIGGLTLPAIVARLRLCVTGFDPVPICEKPRTQSAASSFDR
jgi:3-deoxy-D-manno-octulosonic-acid transferase